MKTSKNQLTSSRDICSSKGNLIISCTIFLGFVWMKEKMKKEVKKKEKRNKLESKVV